MDQQERKIFCCACGEDCLYGTQELLENGATDEEVVKMALSESCISQIIWIADREHIPGLVIDLVRRVPGDTLADCESRDLGQASRLVLNADNEDRGKEFFALIKESLTPALAIQFLKGCEQDLLPEDIVEDFSANIANHGSPHIKGKACMLHLQEEIDLPYPYFTIMRNETIDVGILDASFM